MASYMAVISAYYHLYEALDTAILEAIKTTASMFDYGQRQRLPWLKEDVRALGLNPMAPENLLSKPVDTLILDSPAKLAGALYTVEGSALGGQVISRHLATRLGLTKTNGARFLHGYGNEVEANWNAFLTYLETQLTDESTTTSAAHMAREVFRLTELVLDDFHLRLGART